MTENVSGGLKHYTMFLNTQADQFYEIQSKVKRKIAKDYVTTFRTSFIEIQVTTSFSRDSETVW